MLALETIRGVRVVADPAALDGMVVATGSVVLRFAPDDALVLLTAPDDRIDTAYPKAIVAAETGFVGCWLTPEEVLDRVVPHLDWPLPDARPALAQGFVAGVPAKLWLASDRALLLCGAAYADDLAERLA